MVERFSGVLGALRGRWQARSQQPERLDARGWDLSLLGLVLFALMVGIAYLVSRLSTG